MDTKHKKNLFILGASGALSHSVLVYLKNHRYLFNTVTLLDKRDFAENDFIRLAEIDASFIKFHIKEDNADAFQKLLEKHRADIVLDLSDAPTELVANVVFAYGKASYICCAFCTDNSCPCPLGEALEKWMAKQQKRQAPPQLPHIFFTGMNPGAVSMWTAMGVQKFGVPKEIVEFEYDTSRFLRQQRKKMVTWCVPEFIVELVTDPAEIMLGAHKIKNLYPNGLYHQQDMKELFSPILELPEYPQGCIVMHEECLTLSNKYNIPCHFVYTVNRQTMDHIKSIYEEKGKVTDEDLILGDNVNDPLVGSDNIAMRLKYDDKYVYYLNSVSSNNLKETSATDYQVTVGVYAALFALLQDTLEGGIYFPEDLTHTHFPKFLTDNMMIQEFVFARGQDDSLTQTSYDPHITYGAGPFIKL
jgi:homospermidine synthase